MKTLYITASPRKERSKSILLWNKVIENIWWEVEKIDLFELQAPYLTESVIAHNYWFANYENLSNEDKKIVDLQNKLINQIKTTDYVVIAVPMWNLGMPAILKAYFDLIIKVNETFKMENWYVWMINNVKKAYVVGARWWKLIWTPMESYDMLTPQVKGLLWFIWITNIETFWLEWVNALSNEELQWNLDNLIKQINNNAM
jgi:FMN-dependent NADH-azoreductase